MKITLIGNFTPDRQQSMLRFTRMLSEGFQSIGHDVETLSPEPKFTKLVKTYRYSGLPKYLGYLDKYLLFPRTLRAHARKHPDRVYHITDHSNALYAAQLSDVAHTVTCHDLLPLRCARGEIPQQRLGWSGRRLQESIWSALSQCEHIACVSKKTKEDLIRLGAKYGDHARIVYNGLNHPYRRILQSEAQPRLRDLCQKRQIADLTSEPFLMSVGDDSWYKNRDGIARIFSELQKLSGPHVRRLVMVGAPLNPRFQSLLSEQGIAAKVTHLSALDSDALEALYNLTEGLLFPSWEEGFGWPIAEALSCGARVFTSNRAPMTEVGGPAAVYIDPATPELSAEKITTALRSTPKENLMGIRQASQFSAQRMIAEYGALYESIALKNRQR